MDISSVQLHIVLFIKSVFCEANEVFDSQKKLLPQTQIMFSSVNLMLCVLCYSVCITFSVSCRQIVESERITGLSKTTSILSTL